MTEVDQLLVHTFSRCLERSTIYAGDCVLAAHDRSGLPTGVDSRIRFIGVN